MTNIFQKSIIRLSNYKLVSDAKKARKRLDRITFTPMETQEQFLLQILRDNKDTEYGRKYGFADITSIEEFRQRVPLTTYDDYAEAIERMSIKGEKNVLTVYDIKHYSKSSGTMGNPKHIPFSEKAARISDDYMRGGFIYAASKHGLLGNTPAINLIESHLEILPSGATYGAYTARVIKDNKTVIELIQRPPIEVMMPQQTMNTRYLLALYALRQPDLSYCLCAFYSYFLEILRFIEKNWEMLADDIEQGTINKSVDMPDDVRQKLTAKMTKEPQRAEEIRRIMQNHQNETVLVPLLWPLFRFVEGIGTAGFSTYTEKLRLYFGPDIHFLFAGVIASEGVFSTMIDADTTQSVLLPDSVFYEFKPEEQEGYDHLLTMDQLEEGKNYELIVTNLSGFYRYRLHDVVRITSYYNETPMIRFVYRENQLISIAGEKTNEEDVRWAVEQFYLETKIHVSDYSIYADTNTSPGHYILLVEPDHIVGKERIGYCRDVLEEKLMQANPAYGEMVRTSVLGKMELIFLQQQTYQLYRDMQIMKGASPNQLKPVRVIDTPQKEKFFFNLKEKY